MSQTPRLRSCSFRRCRRNCRTPETLLILQELEKEHAKHCSFPCFGLHLPSVSEVSLISVNSLAFLPKVFRNCLVRSSSAARFTALLAISHLGAMESAAMPRAGEGPFRAGVSHGASEFPGERGGNDEQTHLHLVPASNKSFSSKTQSKKSTRGNL